VTLVTLVTVFTRLEDIKRKNKFSGKKLVKHTHRKNKIFFLRREKVPQSVTCVTCVTNPH